MAAEDVDPTVLLDPLDGHAVADGAALEDPLEGGVALDAVDDARLLEGGAAQPGEPGAVGASLAGLEGGEAGAGDGAGGGTRPQGVERGPAVAEDREPRAVGGGSHRPLEDLHVRPGADVERTPEARATPTGPLTPRRLAEALAAGAELVASRPAEARARFALAVDLVALLDGLALHHVAGAGLRGPRADTVDVLTAYLTGLLAIAPEKG